MLTGQVKFEKVQWSCITTSLWTRNACPNPTDPTDSIVCASFLYIYIYMVDFNSEYGIVLWLMLCWSMHYMKMTVRLL